MAKLTYSALRNVAGEVWMVLANMPPAHGLLMPRKRRISSLV
jgi:hypothetical protein